MAGSSKSNNRKPYNGDRRALVLAFDVGTTFSGVSYAFLEPGEVPKIHGVTRYPGQEHVTGNTKIPSLLYYDRNGRVVAAGAEAENGQITAEAEDNQWFKVELFKLRLRPRRMHLDMNGMRLSPLPPGKSSEDVFGDFLAYLFGCTRKFIEDTHANGANLWHAVENDIHFVLSHPNGWEGAQQSRMRRAAISGGLIPNTDEGKARIRFVTEGEASMHACILSGLAHDVLASGNGFIVADAGGGTLDVSSYILRGTHPLQIEEVAPPDCVFSGAVFVSRRCRVFLEEKLRTSKYGEPDILEHITKRFDETTKRLFRDKKEPQYIQFGSPLDKDSRVGIRSGQLKLLGSEVADLFEPSIQAAVASIRRQIELSRGAVKAVWLVGGFAASPWLFSQLQQRLSPLGVTVNRPDSQTSKAVADGAIGFFCDHHVSARMSRYMYGVEYLREIDVNDSEHITRAGRQLQLPSGPKYLPDAFDCILAKNVRVKESSVFSRKYYTEVTKLSTLSVFEIEIWCYRGGETIPKWIDRNSDTFGSLCFVRADLSRLSNSAEPKKGANGQTYWTVVFSIEIHFGLTEFKSRMKWNEDGKVRYGPATIVYNEKGVRSDEDDAYSVAGGDESMPVSPRRPYGSLLGHSTSGRGTRHRERDRDRGMSREPSHQARAPSLSGAGISRTMSEQTDATSVETVTRDPSPPPASAPPIANSIRSSTRGSSRSRGIGSVAPSFHEPEPEPTLERELESSIHSRAPSMHSRAPSATAPMSTHSRAASTVVPPSPSIHSRAPSMHSRVPSVAPAPSAPHSRTPSAAPGTPQMVSRTPSAAQVPSAVPSRAPSAGAPGTTSSPVPSRAASSSGRASLSRAPSTGSRVPTVARQNSVRSGYGSRAPSQMAPVDEGDLYVPTEPDMSGAAADYFNGAPEDGLDATRTRSRSISPAPPAAEPAFAEEFGKASSKRGSWEVPSVSVMPPIEEKKEEKGWGSFGGGWGSMLGSKGIPAEPGAPGDVPLDTFEHVEEPFVPPVPGGATWDDPVGHPSAPGGWEVVPPAPAEAPAPPEPEVVAPPLAKTSSSKSGKNKKQPKGILKNGSASAKAAEAEAKARAEAEAREREREEAEARARAEAEAEEAARQRAEAEEAARWEAEQARLQAEAEERARWEAEEAARLQAEEEERAREEQRRAQEEEARQLAEKETKKLSKAAERARKAQEKAEAEARAKAEKEAQDKAEAEARAAAKREAQERAEAEARARAEADARAEAEAKARAEAEAAEAAARAKAEEEAAAAAAAAEAEAEAKRKEEEEATAAAAAQAKADAEAAEAAAVAQAEADANAADGVTGEFGAPEPVPAAAAPAVDEERIKLQEAVDKAERDVEKAEEEHNAAEVKLSKVPKPKPKKGKKPTQGPAEKAAEREVESAKKKLDTAKDKLEDAKKALAAHIPKDAPAAAPVDTPAGNTPEEPAQDAEPELEQESKPVAGKGKKGKKKGKATTFDTEDENEGNNLAPPISKVSSNASGKGKKNAFSFAEFGGGDEENKDEEESAPPLAGGNGKKSIFDFGALADGGEQNDEDGEGEKEDGGDIKSGLFSGGGWGGGGGSGGLGNFSFGWSGNGDKSGGKQASWF